jgi:hypothetical protein
MSYSYRETALNWLALGLLLAAWNASDDAGAARDVLGISRDVSGSSREASARPSALRGYGLVSVRAATRTAVISRGASHPSA